jgi:two-component system cell cycle sensor histidine kinase/response regulator CckA
VEAADDAIEPPQAEEKFRTLVEQLPIAVYIDALDSTSSNLYTSPHVEKVLGYSVEDWRSEPDLFPRILHPEDRERVLAEHAKAHASGEPLRTEYRLLARDGRVVWIRDEGVLVQDESGQPGSMQGYMLDITERKEAENELEDAEEKFRILAEQLPLVTYRDGLVPGGPPLYVSPQIEELTGFAPDEWKSDPEFLWKVVHPDDRRRVRAETDRARETGRLQTEYRMVRRDGEVVWVRDVTVTIDDHEGHPIYLQGFFLDITEEKRADAELREGEERYRRLAEQLPLVTYIDWLEADRASLYMSPQIEELTGYSRELWESGREFFRSVVHPDDAELVLNWSRNEAGGFSMEYRLIARDGRVVWVRDESMIVWYEGRPLYAQGFLVDITARKHAEHDLRDAERKYRSLAEHLPFAIFQAPLDAVGPLLYVSPQIEQMFGYGIEEWLTDAELPIRVLHPEDVVRWREELADATARHEPFEAEFRLMAKDGRVLWVEEATVVVRDEDGEPAYRQGYLRDISLRKQSEQRVLIRLAIANVLAESPPVDEALRRILAEIGQILGWNWSAFWAVDPADGTLHAIARWHSSGLEADAFEELADSIRLERGEEFPGRIWETGQPSWIRDFSAADFQRSRAAGQAGLRTSAGCPVVVDNETVGVFELFSTDAKDEDPGLAPMLTVVCSQIGQFLERTEAAKRLRESEDRYRTLVETARDAFVRVDENSVILDWNRQAEQLFGWTKEEAVGRAMPELVMPPRYADAHRDRLNRFLTSGDASVMDQTLTLSAVDRDGVEFPIELTIWPTKDGTSWRFNSFIRDMTERTELEEQLRHAQKMEAVGRLAGGVAHDFNNLLLAIRGYSELALGDLDETAGEARKYIDRIKEATERAASLTGRLLAFSRKQILQPRLVDLTELVSEAADLLRRVLGEGVELETNLEPELQPVQLDPLQVEQTLLNLVINAGDAMDDGGRLTIETANVVCHRGPGEGVSIPAGPYVKLSLSDTGCGMDEVTKERLFEPFFTTKSSGSTGLGLSTVFGFVEQSGGHMLVDSEPGEGATFELYFPPVDSALAPKEVRPAQPDATGTETILLVEDENIVRRMLKTVLTGAGFWVLEARDGAEALVVAAGHAGKIDLMVTDVVMPRSVGSESQRSYGSPDPRRA